MHPLQIMGQTLIKINMVMFCILVQRCPIYTASIATFQSLNYAWRPLASEGRGNLLTFCPKFVIHSVPALALGKVGSLPRASRFRGPHSSKKRALQAVDCNC